MKIKTSELIGPALDWVVASIEALPKDRLHLFYGKPAIDRECLGRIDTLRCEFSTNWAQGGPIIERMGINLSVDYQDDALSNDMVAIGWKGNLWNNSVLGTSGFLQWAYGPTPLIAAMRCYVLSKLGDVVDIPDELCE